VLIINQKCHFQIKPKNGAASCPLHLVAFWKCEVQQTDLRIDYKYNSHAMEMAQSEVVGVNHKIESPSGAQLVQVCIAAPVDGGVKTMQSKPTGQWYASIYYYLPTIAFTLANPYYLFITNQGFQIQIGPVGNSLVFLPNQKISALAHLEHVSRFPMALALT